MVGTCGVGGTHEVGGGFLELSFVFFLLLLLLLLLLLCFRWAWEGGALQTSASPHHILFSLAQRKRIPQDFVPAEFTSPPNSTHVLNSSDLRVFGSTHGGRAWVPAEFTSPGASPMC